MIEGLLAGVVDVVAANPILTAVAGVVLITAAGAARGVLRAVQALAVVVVLAGLVVLAGMTDVLTSGVGDVVEAVQNVLPNVGGGDP